MLLRYQLKVVEDELVVMEDEPVVYEYTMIAIVIPTAKNKPTVVNMMDFFPNELALSV